MMHGNWYNDRGMPMNHQPPPDGRSTASGFDHSVSRAGRSYQQSGFHNFILGGFQGVNRLFGGGRRHPTHQPVETSGVTQVQNYNQTLSADIHKSDQHPPYQYASPAAYAAPHHPSYVHAAPYAAGGVPHHYGGAYPAAHPYHAEAAYPPHQLPPAPPAYDSKGQL